MLSMESLFVRPSATVGVKPVRHSRGSHLLDQQRSRRFLHLGAGAVARNGASATNSLPQRSGVYTVSDFMVTKEDLHVVKPTTSVDEALEMLVENMIAGFPVIDDDQNLVGLVSDYDLLAVDSISGTGRIDRSIFPEVDSTWKAFNEIQKLLSKTILQSNWRGDDSRPPLVVRELPTLKMLQGSEYRTVPNSCVNVGIITRANVVRAALQIKHENNKTSPV
ncbi:hypothetical protein C4D60_Mb01t29170 [Musa balbisiana]|uniref:CBS domain-containing protein n=1 Tax=Musa balbisiana TaxID=52838 RepID=A0A4S8JRJ8_MUSBA|nr:hypothetical protein C4D60_Mb01t29170 [Musa balbisiana]